MRYNGREPTPASSLVEDEPALSRQLSHALDDAGYAADAATDGERADFLVRTESYDAIVLDLGLPHVDALTLLGAWRAADIATPILVLTARGSWHEKVQGIDGGAATTWPSRSASKRCWHGSGR